MNILGIDSSGLVATVALLCDDILVGEYTIHNKKTHSQTLLPMIDQMLTMADFSVKDLDAIAVAEGPGSFTGLRIGASTAKGLGQALQIPLIPVPSLAGLAFNLAGTDSVICAMMDARRNQAYYGIYRFVENRLEELVPQAAAPICDVIEQVNKIGDKTIFVGDGVPVFREQLEKELAVEYAWAEDSTRYQKAASVAVLGKHYMAMGKAVTAKEFSPVYLRMSQAERERMEKKNEK